MRLPRLVAGPPPRVPKRSPRRSPSPTKQDDALHISMPLHRQTSATSSLASAYSQNDSPVVVSKSEQPSIFPTSETPSPPAGEKPTSNSHNRKASVVSVDEQQSILRSPKEDSFGAGFNDEGKQRSWVRARTFCSPLIKDLQQHSCIQTTM